MGSQVYWATLLTALLKVSSTQSPVPSPQPVSPILSRAQEQSPKLAAQLTQRGIEQYHNGQVEAAIHLWKKALAIDQVLHDQSQKGTTLGYLGAAYAVLGDRPQAIAHLLAALAIAKELGDRPQQQQVFSNLSIIYTGQGDFARVIEFQQQHLALVRDLGDRPSETQVLESLGDAHRGLGHHTLAIKYYQEQLTLTQELGQRELEAIAFSNLGLAHYNQRNYTQAVEFHQQSLDIAREIGDRPTVANGWANLGIAHRAMGSFSPAIDSLQKALALHRELQNASAEQLVLKNLGNAYALIGDYDQALTYQRQSLDLAQQHNDQRGISSALGSIGATYANQGQYGKAIAQYQQSLDIARQTGDRKVEGYTLINIGLTHHANRDFPNALKYYRQSLDIAQEIGDRWLEAEALSSLGIVSEGLQDFEGAIDYYDQGFAIFQAIGARNEQAKTLNNQAHTLLKFGKHQDAEVHLRHAIKILDALRNNLDQASQITIFDTQFLTYNLLQQVLIAQNQPQAALEISEHGRARAFVNLLAQRQASKADMTTDIAPPSLTQIRQIAQEQKATLVEYAIVPDDQFLHQGKQLGPGAILYIWVVNPIGEITFREVDLSLNPLSLDKLVATSRESIGVRGRSSVAFTPANNSTQVDQLRQLRQLHQILIQPIADVLPSDPQDRVIFIPQGSLFLTPFPALQDEQGTYLIEKHTLQTAPAIQVLQLTQTHTATTRTENNAKLVVGNPIMPAVSTRIGHPPEQLSPLIGAEQEAISIASLLETKPILGAAATETFVTSQLSNANIIHLATHGLLDDFTGQGVPGAIALAPTGTDAANDGLLTASEILNLKLNAELVVLSACDTGRGDITGDGVVGLSRSWIAAGASSVLVSLWAVPDAPTADLMTEFYHNLQQNPDKAQALRQAMLTLMKQNPNPRDWAAFTLIGET